MAERVVKGLAQLRTSGISIPYSLKQKQLDILQNLMDNKNVFGVLPTGFGKSDRYGLFPNLLDEVCPKNEKHIAVVISPLKSIMADQVRKWSERGVSCAVITALRDMAPSVITGIGDGEYSLLFSSPEALTQDLWWDRLAPLAERVCLLAFDEAHCIISWGTTFRKDFLELFRLRSVFCNARILALTATVTEAMIGDITSKLHLEEDTFVVIGALPDRPAILLSITKAGDGNFQETLEWYKDRSVLEGQKCPKAIIYTRSHDDAANVYAWLITAIHKPDPAKPKSTVIMQRQVEMFHGNTTTKSQNRILSRFREADTTLRVVVATIAFGMGVDIADIRYVLHWGPSKDILSYWQEVGRCSRDGQSGEIIVYIYPYSMHPNRVDQQFIQLLKSVLNDGKCVRQLVLDYFCHDSLQKENDSPAPDRCCCNCAKQLLG